MIDHKQFPTTAGVYAIWHVASERLYIGESINIRKRLYHHSKGYNSSTHLQNAIGHYGLDTFEAEVLVECDPLDCRRLEYIIAQQFVDSVYTLLNNMMPDAGVKVISATVETKAKLREASQIYRASLTPTQRVESARHAVMSMTPEQRSANGHNMGATYQASLTPVQRSENAYRASMSMTPEQRSENAYKAGKASAVRFAALSLEERAAFLAARGLATSEGIRRAKEARLALAGVN